MTTLIPGDMPADYAQRIKDLRQIRGLTQTQLADLVGVSFASVNRWENGQARPNNLSWHRILEVENSTPVAELQPVGGTATASGQRPLDFSGDPEAVWAVAEAHRLANGHLVNPSFAKETSTIDPLPHQLIAVYQHMLDQSPLRFLLADDAGAGKTIMTGLYIREMLARRLIRRVLIVPPAGLIGNWQREMWNQFSMRFRIISGSDARQDNPFVGSDSDLVIVSVDTLAGAPMFECLRDEATEPYDLVVFDEAHKLSADQLPELAVRKTRRYRLAEALAGAAGDSDDWALSWSTQHLLLLTATPHMGKDSPYYYLWRLLLPSVLSTHEAFNQFPKEARTRHFIRRTKEEMVHFDGSPLYPERHCDTFSYELSQGPGSEQELYNEATAYIQTHYNKAKGLNRSAARLAMSVFQRRMASSTYALMRSFERRVEKIERLIEQVRDGNINESQLASQQRRLDIDLGDDPFETQTADEQSPAVGTFEEMESQEEFEDQALGAGVGLNLPELAEERDRVLDLLGKARRLYAQGHESKFEKLREVLRSPEYAGEKFIIFTEHRDTANFLIRRLEGLGFTGRVAVIHGGMGHRDREVQVEFFRDQSLEQGANFLVATDAAGEGINLQFCWLMVNYDIPWNPARLEQRMGRIHRYGQPRDQVVVVNLVSGSTREGRVLTTLLEKLEVIREQLDSDKVFDVVGRLFEDVSIKDYLEQALDDPDGAVERLNGTLTEDQVRAIQEREQSLFGEGGDVKQNLPSLNQMAEEETYRLLLPGYVRRFVEKSAPILDLRIEGNLDDAFRLVPIVPRALDPLLPTLETYAVAARDHLTVYRQVDDANRIWMHPGEPLFDQMSASVLERFSIDGLKGAVFSDPYATEPYLFHIARVAVYQTWARQATAAPFNGTGTETSRPHHFRLVGLRQSRDGTVEECPVEHLLFLKGMKGFPLGSEPLAALAGRLFAEVDRFAMEVVAAEMVLSCRQQILQTLPERMEFLRRGFQYQVAELAASRKRLNDRVKNGDRSAGDELARVQEMQRRLIVTRDRTLASVENEPDGIHAGAVDFLVHALVVPALDPEDADLYDADVEAIAVDVATTYERDLSAIVRDVSVPERARRAGLPDWPGFDLLSRRPQIVAGEYQELAIEVKGRRQRGGIQLTDNEWAKACNMRDKYWLYVVFDCATSNPWLVRIQDPFFTLLVGSHETTTYTVPESAILSAAAS